METWRKSFNISLLSKVTNTRKLGNYRALPVHAISDWSYAAFAQLFKVTMILGKHRALQSYATDGWFCGVPAQLLKAIMTLLISLQAATASG